MRFTAIKLVTEFVGPDDIVMLGDLDELVDAGAIAHLTHEPDASFPVTLYVPLYRSSFGCLEGASQRITVPNIVDRRKMLKSHYVLQLF